MPSTTYGRGETLGQDDGDAIGTMFPGHDVRKLPACPVGRPRSCLIPLAWRVPVAEQGLTPKLSMSSKSPWGYPSVNTPTPKLRRKNSLVPCPGYALIPRLAVGSRRSPGRRSWEQQGTGTDAFANETGAEGIVVPDVATRRNRVLSAA
jgi:hypothetical protein